MYKRFYLDPIFICAPLIFHCIEFEGFILAARFVKRSVSE